MKIKYISIPTALLLCTLAGAQDYSAALASIEQNSTTLRTLRSEAEADRMTART